MSKNGRERGSSSNVGIRDRSCKDDDPQQKARLHYVFSFLGKEVRQQTCFFLFFHFALKGPQNFKDQVQLYIPVHLQLKVSVTLNENLCPHAPHSWFEP